MYGFLAAIEHGKIINNYIVKSKHRLYLLYSNWRANTLGRRFSKISLAFRFGKQTGMGLPD
jgi:hypothetical protein